jgi:hypothetical protein
MRLRLWEEVSTCHGSRSILVVCNRDNYDVNVDYSRISNKPYSFSGTKSQFKAWVLLRVSHAWWSWRIRLLALPKGAKDAVSAHFAHICGFEELWIIGDSTVYMVHIDTLVH